MLSRYVEYKDTTKLIWEKLFLVSIPEIYATSETFVRMYGTPITLDRGIDAALSNQWFTRYMTIDNMVDLWKEGAHIKILSEDDIKEIYDLLSLHLEGWKSQLERGINIGAAPIQDLIAMDEFATATYKFARHHLTQEIVDSIFARNLSMTSGVTPGGFFSKPLPTEGTKDSDKLQKEIEDSLPKRDSLGNFLKDRLVSLKTW